MSRCCLLLMLMASLALPVAADPCGMVPPVYTGEGPPIERIGAQQTYVFFKDGVESIAIRPGFRGKVDNFGMLIPFPSPPAIRKVADDIFTQIRAAIDPPEVLFDFTAVPPPSARPRRGGGLEREWKHLGKDEVRVLREEAVGMYQIAVLAAGSAAALKKWMDQHGFRYPDGMDKPCNDYVAAGWCFVAVKTKVSPKSKLDPRPGMRKTDPGLPKGSGFDGFVQAMGFRFRTKQLVVPMRLSAFNKGKLRNIIYLLTDEPMKVTGLPESLVVRQIPGKQLIKNMTDLLPVRIIGGPEGGMQQAWWDGIKARRDPAKRSGLARDMFASDLLAISAARLAHPHEEAEKELLRVGEELGLRGKEIDRLHQAELAERRRKAVSGALKDLGGMTMTVIDGDFPRKHLARENLTFTRFAMSDEGNSPQKYDANKAGPAGTKRGKRYLGAKKGQAGGSPGSWPLVAIACLLIVGAGIVRRRRRWMGGLLVLAVLAGMAGVANDSAAQEPDIKTLVQQLRSPKTSEAAVTALIKAGKPAIDHLVGEAVEGPHLPARGWALVCLSEIGGPEVKARLTEMQNNQTLPMLVRTWAAAGRVSMAKTAAELVKLAPLVAQYPSLGRPIGKRLLDLTRTDEEDGVAALLRVSMTVPQLQQALSVPILALGARKLADAMLKTKDDNARRMAAAYLGTLAQRGRYEAVTATLTAAISFDPKAKRVPWAGGALYVPNVGWQRPDARKFVGALTRWHLWCERNKLVEPQRQIMNGLNSWGLANATGYQMPGGQLPAATWLVRWGRVVGKAEIRRILTQQGVADKMAYKKVLMQLR